MKLQDLTNQIYDKISVIDRAYSDKYTDQSLWNCRCGCGNTMQYIFSQIKKGMCGKCLREVKSKEFLNQIDKLVNTYAGDFLIKSVLTYKGSHSVLILVCRCGKDFECKYCNLKYRKSCKECNLMKKKSIRSRDLCGQQIGDLTVLEKFHLKGNRTWWDCKCSCGRIVSVPVSALTSKKARHCGCKYKRSRGYTYFGEEYPKKPRGRAKTLSLADRQRYKDWQKQVFKINGHICCICKKRGGYLICHHLDGWNWCIERRYDPQNAAVCCSKCHLRFHKKFGFGNNTRSQFIAFRSQYAIQNRKLK